LASFGRQSAKSWPCCKLRLKSISATRKKQADHQKSIYDIKESKSESKKHTLSHSCFLVHSKYPNAPEPQGCTMPWASEVSRFTSSYPSKDSLGIATLAKSILDYKTFLTDILNLLLPTVSRTEITLQRPPKELKKHLEADLRNGWIIAAFAEFVSYECIWEMLASWVLHLQTAGLRWACATS